MKGHACILHLLNCYKKIIFIQISQNFTSSPTSPHLPTPIILFGAPITYITCTHPFTQALMDTHAGSRRYIDLKFAGFKFQGCHVTYDIRHCRELPSVYHNNVMTGYSSLRLHQCLQDGLSLF